MVYEKFPTAKQTRKYVARLLGSMRRLERSIEIAEYYGVLKFEEMTVDQARPNRWSRFWDLSMQLEEEYKKQCSTAMIEEIRLKQGL